MLRRQASLLAFVALLVVPLVGALELSGKRSTPSWPITKQDLLVPFGAEGQSCPRIFLDKPFSYFGRAVTHLYVCTNGIVLFDDPPFQINYTQPHQFDGSFEQKGQGTFGGR